MVVAICTALPSRFHSSLPASCHQLLRIPPPPSTIPFVLHPLLVIKNELPPPLSSFTFAHVYSEHVQDKCQPPTPNPQPNQQQQTNPSIVLLYTRKHHCTLLPPPSHSSCMRPVSSSCCAAHTMSTLRLPACARVSVLLMRLAASKHT